MTDNTDTDTPTGSPIPPAEAPDPDLAAVLDAVDDHRTAWVWVVIDERQYTVAGGVPRDAVLDAADAADLDRHTVTREVAADALDDLLAAGKIAEPTPGRYVTAGGIDPRDRADDADA